MNKYSIRSAILILTCCTTKSMGLFFFFFSIFKWTFKLLLPVFQFCSSGYRLPLCRFCFSFFFFFYLFRLLHVISILLFTQNNWKEGKKTVYAARISLFCLDSSWWKICLNRFLLCKVIFVLLFFMSYTWTGERACLWSVKRSHSYSALRPLPKQMQNEIDFHGLRRNGLILQTVQEVVRRYSHIHHEEIPLIRKRIDLNREWFDYVDWFPFTHWFSCLDA